MLIRQTRKMPADAGPETQKEHDALRAITPSQSGAAPTPGHQPWRPTPRPEVRGAPYSSFRANVSKR